MRIVQQIGRHSWRVLRDDERDLLKRERNEARAAARDFAVALADIADRRTVRFEGSRRHRVGLIDDGSFARDVLRRHPEYSERTSA